MSKIFVANWKENGTIAQALEWVNTFSKEKTALSYDARIIVCPPFTLLSTVSEEIKKERLSINVGAQDVSRFEEGMHTGEVSAKMVAEFASYIIIGHSERREGLGESDEIVLEKIKLAKKYSLTPIVCVSKIEQVSALKNSLDIFEGIIAYEPLFAIGTGKPATEENANAMVENIKTIFPKTTVIYGGSVDRNNVKAFLEQGLIEGVLVGQRSLDPSFFLEILKNAK